MLHIFPFFSRFPPPLLPPPVHLPPPFLPVSRPPVPPPPNLIILHNTDWSLKRSYWLDHFRENRPSGLGRMFALRIIGLSVCLSVVVCRVVVSLRTRLLSHGGMNSKGHKMSAITALLFTSVIWQGKLYILHKSEKFGTNTLLRISQPNHIVKTSTFCFMVFFTFISFQRIFN